MSECPDAAVATQVSWTEEHILLGSASTLSALPSFVRDAWLLRNVHVPVLS